MFVDFGGTAVRLLLARNLKCHFPCHALLCVQSTLTLYFLISSDFKANSPSCFKENFCFAFLL